MSIISHLLPKSPVTRFAPSPTGHLHLGHIVACSVLWGLAKANKAKIILRLEDHDQSRCKKEYEDSILDDLDWLGFEPDVGYTKHSNDPGYRQSSHWDRYKDAVTKLEQQNLVYPCTCSRSFIKNHMKPSSEGYVYNGHCLTSPAETLDQALIRFKTSGDIQAFRGLKGRVYQQNPLEQSGDFPIIDRNGHYTYLLCVAVDDIHDGVNWIIRGEDLFGTTGRSLELMKSLGQHSLPVYTHHPLLKTKDGIKYSKALHSETVSYQRSQGSKPSNILSDVLFLAGILEKKITIQLSDLPDLISEWFYRHGL